MDGFVIRIAEKELAIAQHWYSEKRKEFETFGRENIDSFLIRLQKMSRELGFLKAQREEHYAKIAFDNKKAELQSLRAEIERDRDKVQLGKIEIGYESVKAEVENKRLALEALEQLSLSEDDKRLVDAKFNYESAQEAATSYEENHKTEIAKIERLGDWNLQAYQQKTQSYQAQIELPNARYRLAHAKRELARVNLGGGDTTKAEAEVARIEAEIDGINAAVR